MVKLLQFDTLQAAWEGINEYMGLKEQEVFKHGGIYGTEFIAYNTLITAKKGRIDPNFDFGDVLGYHIKKWTTLVKNYVDFNYLDLLKSEIQMRENKKAKSYNIAFKFSNKYGGGKDCLLNLVFSKKIGEEYPTVFFCTRVSEVTCRLIFDFLLVQRICEYVYGKEKGRNCEVHFFAPSMYVTAERFSMYLSYKGMDKLGPHLSEANRFQRRILQTYKHFTTTDVTLIKYKAHRRCAEAIQRDEDGVSVRKCASMKARNLPLSKLITKLPEEVVTDKQMRAYLKSLTD